MKRRAELFFISSPCRGDGSAGFTLLEVMVSIAVLGMILLMILGTFRLGLSAWEKGESSQIESQKVRVVSQMIARQIKSAFPYRIKTEKAEGDFLVFEGNSRTLKFVSSLPMKSRSAEGFVYAIYEFDPGDRKGRLILYEKRALTRDFTEQPFEKEDGVVLLEDLADVRFEFYRPEDAQKTRASEWVEEWNAREEKQLPGAVRLSFVENREKEFPFVVQASVPAREFEQVKIGPVRRTVPSGALPRPR